MLKLHVVQADFGDSLIMAYGSSASPHYLLIDGGPNRVYQDHLKPVLQGLSDAQTQLDLVVLSHIDEDHVMGLVDLFKDLQWQRSRGRPETVAIAALWHNSFSDILGKENEQELDRFMGIAGPVRGSMPLTDRTGRSVKQGHDLAEAAELLDIDVNCDFSPSHLASSDEAPDAIPLENVSLRLIGPGKARLEKLRAKWLAWLKEQKKKLAVPDADEAERAAVSADDSVPNLSSIMFLAEADGKTILFTGDGLHTDIIAGLEETGLLPEDGNLHVNVLKVPHHGSNRNVSQDFFYRITADTYVISANDRTGQDNPDYDTLKWLVVAARDQGRTPEIVVTNMTKNTKKILRYRKPEKYGYHLTLLQEGEHAMVLDLAP